MNFVFNFIFTHLFQNNNINFGIIVLEGKIYNLKSVF